MSQNGQWVRYIHIYHPLSLNHPICEKTQLVEVVLNISGKHGLRENFQDLLYRNRLTNIFTTFGKRLNCLEKG